MPNAKNIIHDMACQRITISMMKVVMEEQIQRIARIANGVQVIGGRGNIWASYMKLGNPNLRFVCYPWIVVV